MEIDLVINNIPISLGENFDLNKLRSADCKKAGLMTRWQLKLPKGQTLYWVKNCRITSFDKKFNYWAVLGSGPQDIDYVCGTSAYLFYNNERLLRIIFQVIHSAIQATAANHEMKQIMTNKFGSPTKSSSLVSFWEEGNETFVCELNARGDNAYFHWFYE